MGFNATAEETKYELYGDNLGKMEEAFGYFIDAMFSPEHTFSPRELMLFEHLIDSDIIDYDTYMKLYNETMEVDYQLVDDSVVITDDYFAVITDGTFRPFNHDELKIGEHNYRSNIPLHMDGKSPAQIIISDYTMNSLVKAAEDLGWFDRTFNIKASSVETYISDFE